MIEEMIPDLFDPRLRALYDALRGRREATETEKVVLVAVCQDMAEGFERGDMESTLPNVALALQIGLVIERAMEVDKVICDRCLCAYVADVTKLAKEKRANA